VRGRNKELAACFPRFTKSAPPERHGEASRFSLKSASRGRLRRETMLKWALIFAVIALIAGGLGFGGVAGAAAGVAKILFFLFVVGFLIFLALGLMAGKKIAGD
jgi:uncharacterized membrane protein YtjA (UPF0391 family)